MWSRHKGEAKSDLFIDRAESSQENDETQAKLDLKPTSSQTTSPKPHTTR